MTRPLTIELPADVMAWLEDQAAELARELSAGQGGDGAAELVTPAAMAAAFVTHQFNDWTGEAVKKESK